MDISSNQRADDTYKHRYRIPEMLDERFPWLIRALETVRATYEKTDPTRNGNAPLPDKNWEASNTLHGLGRIVAEIGGWAIDHETGKAVCGIGWLTTNPAKDMEAKAAQTLAEANAIANAHQMEKIGGEVRGFYDVLPFSMDHRSEPVDIQRLMLINVLSSLNNGLRIAVLADLIAGLRELNVGGVPELLKPVKNGHAYKRAQCWLTAAEYVEYWQAYDNARTRSVYKRHVAEAFGLVDADDINGVLDDRIRTVANYAKQAGEHLGTVLVEHHLALARHFGMSVRRVEQGQEPGVKSVDLFGRYSRDWLLKAGQEYRGLRTQPENASPR